MLRDLTFAARALRRSPVFAAAAALTIGLGIAASTAIFSVASAVLLRPLPYRHSDRLVVLYADLRARNDVGMPISGENYTDIRNGTTAAFDDMAAVSTGRQIVPAADGTPEQVRSGLVTTNFFRVMGAAILLGRDFDEEDGTPPPAPAPVAGTQAAPPSVPTMAILSYEYWQRRFGGDAGILGKDLPGNGPRPPQRIVGVLAPGFQLLFRPTDNMEVAPDVWTALRLTYNNAESQRLLPPPDRAAEGRRIADARAGRSRVGRQRHPQEFSAVCERALLRARRADARRTRAGSAAGDPRADGRGGLPPAHRLRKRDQSAARARVAAAPRTGGPIGARRRPLAHRQADAGGGCAVDGDLARRSALHSRGRVSANCWRWRRQTCRGWAASPSIRLF